MKYQRTLFGIFMTAALFVAGSTPAWAADELDLSPNDDQLFDAHNMVPGESKTEEFCAQNEHGTEAVDFYLNIENVTDDSFAGKLKFYLTDRSSGNYFIGGAGDRFTVKKMNSEGNVFIERLSAGEENCYKMKIAFDADAGNEFQSRKTVFDMDFKLVSEVAAGQEPLRPGVPAGGVAAALGEVAGESVTVPEAAGATTETSGVLGAAEESCTDSWPLWVWILMLVVHTIVSGAERFLRYPWLQKFGLLVQVAALIGVLALWYFFDVCRLYPWVPYTALALTVITLLVLRLHDKGNRLGGGVSPQ